MRLALMLALAAALLATGVVGLVLTDNGWFALAAIAAYLIYYHQLPPSRE